MPNEVKKSRKMIATIKNRKTNWFRHIVHKKNVIQNVIERKRQNKHKGEEDYNRSTV